MATQDAVRTTQEVVNRFSELVKEGKWMEIQEELYADNAASIEPPHAAAQGLKMQKEDAIRKKGKEWNNMIEEMHDGWCSEPVVGGNHFSVGMGMDVTIKGAGRMQMDEIAVYEVKDGKM